VAARLLLSGDLLSGTDAAAAGLVAASLPDGKAAMTEALALARRVAMQSPLAVRATLRTLRQRADADLERALMREADAQAQSYASVDYAEGLAAVRAKRTPSFDGA
jgi:enoyl-CoA hydratase